MALDDIPNKLLQFPKPHDTCPRQLHQAVLHPSIKVKKMIGERQRNEEHALYKLEHALY